MSSPLKIHFQGKHGYKAFQAIRAEATFVIRIQDGNRPHLFTIKMTAECRFYTYFQIKSKVSKEVAAFILQWDHDLEEAIYLRERDRQVMLVQENQCYWIGFSSFCPLTLSLYQAEKVMKQIYEMRKFDGIAYVRRST